MMSTPSILIVEDEAVLARSIESHLKSWGFEVAGSVDSGEEAIQKACATQPDLVLMDIRLRGPMDGIEAAGVIRSRCHSSIMYLTAHSDKELFERAKTTHPMGYLIKPISPLDLRRAVEVALYKHKSERELRETESALELALDGADLGLWDWNVKTGFALRTRRLANMLGYLGAETELDVTAWKELVHPDDWATTWDALIAHLQGRAQHYEAEYRIRAASGEWKWILARGRAVEWDEYGTPLRISGTTLDVTDRRRMMEEIQSARDDLEVRVRLRTEELSAANKNLLEEATQRKSAEEELRQKVEELSAIERFSHAVSSSLSPDEVLVIGRQEILSTVAPDCLLVFLRRQEELVLRDEVSHNEQTVSEGAETHMVGVCLCGVAAREGVAHYSTNIHVDPRCTLAECKQAGYTSFAALPVKYEGAMLGVIGIASLEERDFCRHAAFLETLCAHLAVALRNAQLHEQLKRANEELDQRVKERTADLIKANEQLRSEVSERKHAQEALFRSQQRYRAVVETQTELICRYLPDGTITFANDAYLRFFGKEMDDLLGERFSPETPEDDAYDPLEHSGRFSLERPIVMRERRVITPDRQVRWLRWMDRAIFDDRGEIQEFQGVGQDITDRKNAEDALLRSHQQLEVRVRERTLELTRMNDLLMDEIREREHAEEELRKSEQRYRTLFEQAADSIYILDTEDDNMGRIVSANKAAASTHGYSIEEMLGMKISDLETPDYAKLCQGRIEAVLKEGHLRARSVHRTKDGALFPVEINGGVMELGDKKYVLAMDRDITAQERVQAALKSSEERMRTVIELSPIGICVVRARRFVFVNPAFLKLVGYDYPEELYEKHVEDFLTGEARDQILEKMRATVRGKPSPSFYEARLVRRDGQGVDVEIWGARIEFDGKPASLSFVSDVSEAKRLRTQLLQAQKMEALGTLAGGVSHDLNNLLTAVIGYAETLLDDHNLPEKAASDVERILHAGERGADLVRRILTFTRKVETKPLALNLNHQIVDVKQMLARTIPKMVDIQLDLGSDLRQIYADPSQIVQILMNLAVNAKDSMPDGGVLKIQTRNVRPESQDGHPIPDAGEEVMLSVSDTGHGMSKQTQERMYEPFFTTKRVGEGTGLGLAMIYGMVQEHKGRIECDSELGRGATFRIYFPAIEEERRDRRKRKKAPVPRGRETVLLVDDEEVVRELASRWLSKAGYTVLTAENGREAIDIYSKMADKVSLVVLDLIMPEMSGKQCLEQLLQIDSEVRVLVGSGIALTDVDKRVKRRGARGFVSKPYNSSKLLEAVRATLDSR